MYENAASESSSPQGRSETPESAKSIRISKHSASTHSGTHLDYEPIPLRWPTISALLFIICGLLVMLEYAYNLALGKKPLDTTRIPQEFELSSRMILVTSNAKPVVNATPSTAPSNISPNRTDTTNYLYFDRSGYFIEWFLPILSVLLSILVQVVDKNLKTMLPFYALTRPNGATAEDSLCMIPGGLLYLPRSFRLLYRRREPLSFLSDLLVILSSLLVSISSDAVEIKVYGICMPNKRSEGCYLSWAHMNGPFRVGEALTITMATVVVLIWFFRSRARSGIASNSWSIAASSSLLSDEVGKLLCLMPRDDKGNINESQLLRVLEGKLFALQNYQGSQGTLKYGITVLENGTSKSSREVKNITSTSSSPQSERPRKSRVNYFNEQVFRDYSSRLTLLTILFGLLILILYYETKQMAPLVNSLELFMDNRKFGVRFLFSASGVVIALFWDSIFSRMTIMQPYKYLSQHNSYTKTTITISPATAFFSALWIAIRQKDPFAFTVSFASALSKFTPIVLSNIPFHATQTWTTHVVCAWMIVSILAFMILVLLWSFFIKWPYLPVDPSTIAGNMYYTSDSAVLKDFEGLSVTKGKEVAAYIQRSGRKYQFGEMIGLSGELRIGIHCDKDES